MPDAKKILDTPEGFLSAIPGDLRGNLDFRKKVNTKLAGDNGMQRAFLELCWAKPQIAYKTLFWTFDPRKEPGCRNLPFITRPAQDRVIGELWRAINTGSDYLIEKSRDEGATEIVIKAFVLQMLLSADTMFLIGSRKQEFVWKPGDHKALFSKVLYTLEHLPHWLRLDPKTELDTKMLHCRNLRNGSVIDGESTNENFGAGDRRTAILLDEFGRVDYNIARQIRNSVNDVANSVIYNSTHFYGAGHPFARLRRSGKIKVGILPWYENPVKAQGMYRSPSQGMIEVKDVEYYKKRWPKAFQEVYKDWAFPVNSLYQEWRDEGIDIDVAFKADGEEKWRSPWYDEQERRRDSRDMAQNIDMNPEGSADAFFDITVCQKLRSEQMREPVYQGEIEWQADTNGKLHEITFRNQGGKKRLNWWGELANHNVTGKDIKKMAKRPPQDDNYVVACDIGLGTGVSNSVAKVYSVNKSELAGSFASPNITPERFADYVVALSKWVGGGTRKAYLIWEANGPGEAFRRRVFWHGYDFVYSSRDERHVHRRKKQRYGWYSNKEAKYDLLLDLRIALSEGLKNKPNYKSLRVPDEATIKEYEDYIFTENGDLYPSQCVDENTGAKRAHGDRVIPDGLFILALREQPRASSQQVHKPEVGSFAWRQARRQTKRKRSKMEW